MIENKRADDLEKEGVKERGGESREGFSGWKMIKTPCILLPISPNGPDNYVLPT